MTGQRKTCVLGVAVCVMAVTATAWAGGGEGGVGIRVAKAKHKQRAVRAKADRGVASPNAVRAKTAGELVFGNPIHYQNIALVPVGTTAQGPFQNYSLLEEGLSDGSIRIREMRGNSGAAQVNQVEVRNAGNLPLYLLGGEAILGGKQDRIIEQDTVVPNTKKWTKVSVFCVERGRWAGQNMKFSAGKALAHIGLQKARMSGSQSTVWAEVAKKNLRHGTQSRTSTYRRTIQNSKIRKKIAPYRRDIQKAIPDDMKLAGVVFAINGKIQVADLFGNPVLMGKLQGKLFSSYILEALGQKVVRNAPRLGKAGAAAFISKARKAKRYRLKGKKAGRAINYKKESADVIGAETMDRATGKTVRETYLAK